MLRDELTVAARALCTFDEVDPDERIPHIVARFHDGLKTAKVVIIHPLWETSAMGKVHDSLLGLGLDNAIFIDTYNLARRFSECYRKVLQRLREM